MSRFTAKLIVRERNPVLASAASVAVLGGLALLSAIPAFGVADGIYGAYVAIVGAILSFLVLWKNLFSRRREIVVQADESGLRVGKRFVPRAAIEDGFFQPRTAGSNGDPRPSSVRLVDSQDRLLFEAEVDSHARAECLLRALALDASNRSARFRASSRVHPNVAAATALLLLVLLTACAVPPLVLGLLLAFPILLGFAPTEVVVGTDGILVQWLWRARFIPTAELKSVVTEGEHIIRIRYGAGREQILRSASKSQTLTDFGRERRDAIHARIVESWIAWRTRRTADLVGRLSQEGPRTTSEWRRSLAELRNDRGYRLPSLRDDDLWRIVEDPSAPPDARAAAAALLRPSLDEAGRARVRVASAATASPRLRIALGEVADDPELRVDSRSPGLIKEAEAGDPERERERHGRAR